MYVSMYVQLLPGPEKITLKSRPPNSDPIFAEKWLLLRKLALSKIRFKGIHIFGSTIECRTTECRTTQCQTTAECRTF
jgi:hypothetical protein